MALPTAAIDTLGANADFASLRNLENDAGDKKGVKRKRDNDDGTGVKKDVKRKKGKHEKGAKRRGAGAEEWNGGDGGDGGEGAIEGGESTAPGKGGEEVKASSPLSQKQKNGKNRLKKQQRKAQKVTKPPKTSTKAVDTTADQTASTAADDDENNQAEEKEPTSDPNNDNNNNNGHRFIVFLGNLPYDTTTASLQSHLAAVKPTSIRLATFRSADMDVWKTGRKEKNIGKCKGYAFVEFGDAGRMQTCLSLFHHTVLGGRKINVELTAGGGGGKSSDRKNKLKAKNEKLTQERKRKFEEAKKAKAENGGEGENAETKKEKEKMEQQQEESNVHPSRRKKVWKGKTRPGRR